MTEEENYWQRFAQQVEQATRDELDRDPDQLFICLAQDVAHTYAPLSTLDVLRVTAAHHRELARRHPRVDSLNPVHHMRANLIAAMVTTAQGVIDRWEEDNDHEEEHES